MYGDERNCTNCRNLMICWQDTPSENTPEEFTLRAGWDWQRMREHMLQVMGQICGSFQHGDDEINARHVRAERRRRDELGIGNEWDEEEN